MQDQSLKTPVGRCPASSIDLMDHAAFARTEDTENFRRLRDEDPLHWNEEPDGGEGFWSVTRYADVKAVASDAELFTVVHGTQIASRRTEGEGDPSIHHLDAPRHKPLRGVVASEMRLAKVRKLESVITQVIDELLDAHVGTGRLDLVAQVTSKLPLVMIGRLLGVPLADCHRLLDWSNRMTPEDPEFDDGTGAQVAVKARDEIFAYFQGLEGERRECPADDLISVLAAAEVDGASLSRGSLDAYYLLLMFAGNETTRNLLTGGLLALREAPQWWDYMRNDPSKVRLTVEETVRYLSPVLQMRRSATRDTEMHGKTIRAGDKVVLWFCSANQDERAFERPLEFIGDRHPNEHLGFGWGTHNCLGSHLARLEGRIFFERLVARGIEIDIVDEPDRLSSNRFRGIKRLAVEMRQR